MGVEEGEIERMAAEVIDLLIAGIAKPWSSVGGRAVHSPLANIKRRSGYDTRCLSMTVQLQFYDTGQASGCAARRWPA